LFTKFEDLWKIVEQFNVDKNVQKAIVNLKTEGKKISLTDKDLVLGDGGGLYYILNDGTLTKQTLYVSDEDINKLQVLEPLNSMELPKYHIYNCGVVKEFKTSGKKKNYKISLRDDGTFHFVLTDNDDVIKEIKNQELEICQTCLRIYNKNHQTHFTKNKFSLKDFFSHYSTCFNNLNIDSLEYSTYYKESDLTKDWHTLSHKMKEKKDFRCQKCSFKAKNSYEQKFLHTHHIPSSKTYSGFDKLKVFCVTCHALEPEHTDIKSAPIFKEFKEYLVNKKEAV